MVPKTAIQLIKKFEGCKLEAYRCPAGKLTIGYGSTKYVKPGMKISMAEANNRLINDANEAMEGVEKLVKVTLNETQLAVLIDFVFNFGETRFGTSRLLRMINSGKHKDVPNELKKWIHAAGKVEPGLVKRRAEEAQLWEQSLNEEQSIPTAS